MISGRTLHALFRATIALRLHRIERLRGVPLPAPAGRGRMQILDLDLRVGMHSRHDRLFVLAAHNYVVTKSYHGPSLRQYHPRGVGLCV
jgi:hypothetical protein